MVNAEFAQQRILAWLIDFLVMLGLGLLFQAFGWLVAGAYLLLRDALFNNGQSIGKRLMGLRVVLGADRTPCTFLSSVIRNLLWLIPIVNIVMAFAGLYALSSDRAGRHWGDRLADTRVVAA